MRCKFLFIAVFSAVMLTTLCFLVRYASHSTDEAVRRRAVMAYYHTIGRNAEKREAARYLLDNMPCSSSAWTRLWRYSATYSSATTTYTA